MPAHAFDDLAVVYDADFTDTIVGRALRDTVWSHLDDTFGPSDRVLELGCGTGEDAVRLAARGIRVVATDASGAMIEMARRKALGRGCAGAIEFHCVDMENLLSFLGTEKFDGVLSNFGALNCVRDLRALTESVAARVVPGDRKSTRLNSSHHAISRMPSSA